MREYTTLEVIKELKDNKKLKFKGIGRTYKEVNVYVKFDEGIDIIKWKAENECEQNMCLTEFVLNMKWTKVQEPVDFMTALNSGKRFKHKLLDRYRNLESNIIVLSDLYNNRELKEMFNSKEWYVEE